MRILEYNIVTLSIKFIIYFKKIVTLTNIKLLFL